MRLFHQLNVFIGQCVTLITDHWLSYLHLSPTTVKLSITLACAVGFAGCGSSTNNETNDSLVSIPDCLSLSIFQRYQRSFRGLIFPLIRV